VIKKRPVNLDLTTIKQPITAVASILHRISGVILFLAIPFFLWLLQTSLNSTDSFNALQTCLNYPLIKFGLWLLISALLYHLLAGIRHLLMDCGLGESKCGGRLGAKLVIISSLILAVFAGVALW